MFHKDTGLMLFFTAVLLSITITQSTSSESTKTGNSFVNEATSLGFISSRFLDLGGVIRQLFSGFNQGTSGGSTGLNYPPNSQFYFDVLAQGQPSSGFQNKWSNLNQGLIQGSHFIGGIQSQQLNRPRPNSLNFNLQTVQHQGQLSKQAQSLAQILNIQNNNGLQPGPSTSELNGNSRFPRSDVVPQTPTPFTFEGGHHGAVETRNEGTLEDFFKTESTNNKNNENKVVFPNYDGEATLETTTRNSIWGKLVKIPTTTVSSDRIVFVDDSETPYQKQCVQNCPTTSEYNPVCGTDSVTYFNPGRLVCARNCGIDVRQRRRGSCNSKSG